VDARWVAQRRRRAARLVGQRGLPAFDITYDYDIFLAWENVLAHKLDLRFYMDMLRLQDCIYPENYVKLRFVENHDKPRIMSVLPERNQALAWTAFQAFNKGAWLIYAGAESATAHLPSLFEKEPIPWGDYPLTDFLRRLSAIKKEAAVSAGDLTWAQIEPAVLGIWYSPAGSLAGIFNVSGNTGEMGRPSGRQLPRPAFRRDCRDPQRQNGHSAKCRCVPTPLHAAADRLSHNTALIFSVR
jgi:hypothetical protein